LKKEIKVEEEEKDTRRKPRLLKMSHLFGERTVAWRGVH
jgi:hypothetical protein